MCARNVRPLLQSQRCCKLAWRAAHRCSPDFRRCKSPRLGFGQFVAGSFAQVLADDDFKMAPCLVDGPLADSGARLIEASRRLPSSGASTALRGWAVAAAFDAMERVFAAESDPRDAVAAALAEIATELDGFAVLGSLGAGLSDEGHEDVAAETGSHYGNLFAGFSPQAYFDEAANLLRTRLDRNGVAVPTRASVLDAGCGGGRYTVAWTKAGADRAVGIDISSSGVADARRRFEAAGRSRVSVDLGSVP